MSQQTQTPLQIESALSILSAAIGNGMKAESIKHGFPLSGGSLQVPHLEDASNRAGLKLVAVNPVQVQSYHCPLLFCHPAGRAVVIAEIDKTGKGLALSSAADTYNISVASLIAAGFHACYSVRPLETYDARTEYAKVSKRHWIIENLWMAREIVPSVILATAFTNVLALAVPLITMNVMDRVVAHASFATLWALAIGGMVALFADFLLRMLRGTLIDRASAAGDVIVNNRIFSRVIGARMGTSASSVGVKSNTLREFDSLRELSNAATIATLGDLPFSLLFLAVIAMVTGWLVFVPIAMIPVLFGFAYFTQRRLDELVTSHYKDTAHKNAVAVEMLTNIETIKSHCGESWAAGKWERAVASYLRHSLAMRWWMAYSGNINLLLQGSTTIALLIVGVYLIANGKMSGGALFAATMLTGRALSPISQMAALITKYHHAKTAFKSIRHLVDAEQERPEGMRFVGAPKRFISITLDHLSVSYHKDAEPALKDITLEISAGERIGIIGGIGSGKSTLLRILLGLRNPTGGSIVMDGIPVRQIDPSEYRKKFGTAFREEGFFFGSIRENLGFHVPNATDDALMHAAKMGGAYDWISKKPTGLDTIVGENGNGLSSGQKQTLALSRAFAGSPEIIMLDEPTSDLDSKTEAEFVSRLRRIPSSQTLIAVTHRPAVVEACTRLIVIDQGKIVMDGEKSLVLDQLRQSVERERSSRAA